MNLSNTLLSVVESYPEVGSWKFIVNKNEKEMKRNTSCSSNSQIVFMTRKLHRCTKQMKNTALTPLTIFSLHINSILTAHY